MNPGPRSLTAMAHVASVQRSIEFYSRLGFSVRNRVSPEGASEPVWAHLESNDAHLMVARADGEVDPAAQAVLFYLYFDDIAATHARMKSEGFDVGEMAFPFYCPKGEFRLIDPDGYVLMLTHT